MKTKSVLLRRGAGRKERNRLAVAAILGLLTCKATRVLHSECQGSRIGGTGILAEGLKLKKKKKGRVRIIVRRRERRDLHCRSVDSVFFFGEI